ncbi:MAG: NHLP leader peptide family RiPP precursor [Gammaproteobacteria bacterium]|nr:NHLP leader peptide family RiPP precursor [Gammaproteobacteria bacterium]
MKKPFDLSDALVKRAGKDSSFRERLLGNPKDTIEREFGVTLPDDHGLHVHEETHTESHVVLPPRSKLSDAEREEARGGATSLEFLKKMMHDPAPPMRPPVPARASAIASDTVVEAARESIRRGLGFLESAIDENGAWHCIRFNVADPGIPRHYERPPFVSALCALALESSIEPRANAIRSATKAYLAETIEYPGLWRYYRHLPQDLDSSTLCSLVVGTHPWISLGRNVPRMLANRDEEGRFMTWVLDEDEPNVVAPFRIEADPVVNANVIAYLGDRPATKDAQRWLAALIDEERLGGSSKWYPDTVSIYYAITRAMVRAQPALGELRPVLADRIADLRDEKGGFGNMLQTAQAVTALDNVGGLERIDAKRELERLLGSQRDDGSWPEFLAFGDQSLKWGQFGQIGHGSEAVTSAFCLEALERLAEALSGRASGV